MRFISPNRKKKKSLALHRRGRRRRTYDEQIANFFCKKEIESLSKTKLTFKSNPIRKKRSARALTLM